ncbi:MAG TPA: hypothetical protein VK507_10515 [Iamia sp.]|nr:hypothetical protein [Iamia sp.]
MATYPSWCYFPSNTAPPGWVDDFVGEVAAVRSSIDSSLRLGAKSDDVLKALRPGLTDRGYVVERGKRDIDKILRPVLFGERGVPLVKFEIDAWHPEERIVVEIEAGRGAKSNAVERDLLRTALMVDARFLVLGVMNEYWSKSRGKDTVEPSYRNTNALIGAIFASGRLKLPFEGVLVFGY